MNTHARDDEEQQPLLGSEAHPVDPATQSLSSRLRSALDSPRTLTALEKALALLAVVLLLTTATFAGLFGGEAVKYDRLKRHRPHSSPVPTATVTATRTTSTLHGPTPTAVPPAPPAPPSDPDELCLTGACVKAAAGILASLDTSHDPCVDPYLFANGGWLDSHPIPRGKGSYGAFEAISERNQRVIRSVLARKDDDEGAEDLDSADERILETLRTYYDSCLDEETIEAKGSEPLLDVVDEVVSLWRGEQPLDGASALDEDVDDDEYEDDTEWLLELNGVAPLKHHNKKKDRHHGGGSKRKWDPKTARTRLTNALAFLHSRGIPALFETYTDGDVGADPSTVVLWLSQAGLGLPSKGYYKDKDTLSFYEGNVAEVLAEVYKRRGEKDMGGLAEAVVALEKQLAKISLEVCVHLSPSILNAPYLTAPLTRAAACSDELDQPVPTYNPHNASSLQSLFPSISFANYFASFTPRPRFPDPVIVTAPTYFGNLTGLLEHTAPDVLEAYFVVQASQAVRCALTMGSGCTLANSLAPCSSPRSWAPNSRCTRRSSRCQTASRASPPTSPRPATTCASTRSSSRSASPSGATLSTRPLAARARRTPRR